MPLTLSQPAILNVLDSWYENDLGDMVGMQAGTLADITFEIAQQNAAVLQTIVNYAQTANCDQTNPYGAMILFPGHDKLPTPPGGTGDDDGARYFLALPDGQTAAVNVDCNWPLLFKGTGNVKLVMMLDSGNATGDMFAIQNNGQDNTGGMTFEDLTFQYPAIPGEPTTPPAWAAIHLLSGGGAQNIRINRCNFLDCPIGLWAQDGLQISVSNLT